MSALAACNDNTDNTKTNISPSDLDFLFIEGNSIIAGKAGNKISVDASHSYSTAHSPLHFQWSVKSQPANSSITISDDATATPSFTPIQVGIYELSLLLTDNNKETQSTTFTIIITGMGTNAIPIAIAGSDQHVKIGSLTHLDATHSNDADSDTLTYLWSIVTKPSASTVSLSNTTAAQPQFTPDIAGNYVFSLVVNDANDDSTNVARTTITVTPAHHNSIPIANAGLDQTLQPHHQVSLSGQSSHDND
jgi:hypothetical protein